MCEIAENHSTFIAFKLLVYGLRPENKGCWYHLEGINVLVIFMKFDMIQNTIHMIDISKVGQCAFLGGHSKGTFLLKFQYALIY